MATLLSLGLLISQLLQLWNILLADSLQHAAQAREVSQEEARQPVYTLQVCHLNLSWRTQDVPGFLTCKVCLAGSLSGQLSLLRLQAQVWFCIVKTGQQKGTTCRSELEPASMGLAGTRMQLFSSRFIRVPHAHVELHSLLSVVNSPRCMSMHVRLN